MLLWLMLFLKHSAFQSATMLRQLSFIPLKTATSRGCMKWVEFSGRKMNLDND